MNLPRPLNGSWQMADVFEDGPSHPLHQYLNRLDPFLTPQGGLVTNVRRTRYLNTDRCPYSLPTISFKCTIHLQGQHKLELLLLQVDIS